MANPFYLDSDTAKTAIRRGKKINYIDDFMATAVPNLGENAQAIPQPQDVTPPPQNPSTQQRSRNLLEGFQPGPERDFSWMDSYTKEPVPVQPAKPKEEGFFTGLGKAISGGVQDTAGSLFSAGATAVDARGAVVDSARAAAARSPDQALALQQFNQEIKKRQAADDSGLLAGIKNVAGAVYDNPEGAFQMVVSQLPNTAVSLGAGAAGGAAGFALGGPLSLIHI